MQTNETNELKDIDNSGVDWTERWNDKVDEVDAKIIAFFKQAGKEIGELYDDVRWQFKKWAEDAKENTAQYERDHPSSSALHAKIDSRVDELEKEGKIERQRDQLLSKQPDNK